MRTVLVTGGSKGIGFEFTKQYLVKDWRVVSTCRNPNNASDLEELKLKFNDRLSILKLDVSDEKSRKEFFNQVNTHLNHLDLLLNNAGIKSGNERTRYEYGELTQEDLCQTYLVNSVGPLLISQGLTRLLENSRQALIVNLTSINGSITNKNRIGGWGYSASKAALNIITKMLSIELKERGINVISLHPGWVKTPMTADENAPLRPSESIRGMISVIENLTVHDTGKFYDWKGNEISW